MKYLKALPFVFLLIAMLPIEGSLLGILARKKANAGSGATFPTDQLVAFWPLDEASGDAVDSYGSNDLTENGTVSATTITIDSQSIDARDCDDHTANYFQTTSVAGLDVGSGDFTYAAWVEVATGQAATRQHGTGSHRLNIGASNIGWITGLENQANGDVSFRAGDCEIADGTNEAGLATDADTGFNEGEAGYIMVVVDRTADTMKLYGNNVEVANIDISSVTGSLSTTDRFQIGKRAQNITGTGVFKVTHAALWHKALDSSERDAAYNGGAALAP